MQDVSDNTLKAYEHATCKLEGWLEGRLLTDAVLAEYISFLHAQGKSPATINLVLSAVKWMAEYHGIDALAGAATERVMSDVREEGKGRRGAGMRCRGIGRHGGRAARCRHD